MDGNFTALAPVEQNVRAEEVEKIELVSSSIKKIEENKTEATSVTKIEILSSVKVEDKSEKGVCDFTRGKWVYDESYPLYTNGSCALIDEGFNCQGNGRLDKDYMKWRWQPQDCEIPRYFFFNHLDLMSF